MIVTKLDGHFVLANQQDAEALLGILNRARPVKCEYVDTKTGYREVVRDCDYMRDAEIRIATGDVLTQAEFEQVIKPKETVLFGSSPTPVAVAA